MNVPTNRQVNMSEHLFSWQVGGILLWLLKRTDTVPIENLGAKNPKRGRKLLASQF
jgi:hypothetical protein